MPDPQSTPDPDAAAAADAVEPGGARTPDAVAVPHDAAAPDAGAVPLDAEVPPDTAEVAAREHVDGPAASVEPTEEQLLSTAEPATVRRAPRYGAFITAGALVGIVVGLLLAVLADNVAVTDSGGVLPFLGGSNGPRLLSALAGAVVGTGVGAGLALWADRRSLRR